MTAETIRVEGLDELRDVLLRKLPENLRGKAMQATLAKAAAPIVKAARAGAPRDKGRLRRAIYSYRDRQSTRDREARLISVRRGKKTNPRAAFYWKFIEFGHMTRRGKGKAGPPRFIPPVPFMRPAFESNKYLALRIAKDELKGQIQKVAERAVRRSASRLSRALRRTVTGL